MEDEYDLTGEGSRLARRKALVDAMLKQTLEADARVPTTQQGGVLAVLGDVLRKRKVEKESAQLDTDMSAYQGRYSKQLNSELGNYLDTRNGRAATGNEPPNGMEGPMVPQPAQAPDPRKAVMQALASRMPELQKMGQAEFAQIGKRPEITEHVINGQLVRSDKVNAPQVAGTYKSPEEWGPVEQISQSAEGKPIMGQRNKITGKVDTVGGGGQTINFNPEAKGDQLALAKSGEVLEKARGTMMTAQQNIDTATRIFELSKDPQLISGKFAEPALFLSAVGAKLGLNGPDAAAKTQAMMTDLASNALAKGQLMKGSFSDADIKFLKEASAGQISLTPEVMRQVAALSFAVSHNEVLDANKQYNSASQIPGAASLAQLFPRPDLRYSNIDPERLKDDEQTGRMKYISPLTSPGGSQPRAPIVTNW